jgi:hypothetical protein
LKSQHLSLLNAVTQATTDYANSGTPVNVKVQQVVTTFPDGSTVIFAADNSTEEQDWEIIMSGPTAVPGV